MPNGQAPQTDEIAKSRDLGTVERAVLGAYLHLLLLALVYALACVWPIAVRIDTQDPVRFRILFTNIGALSPSLALFWAVALLGALGGALHAAGSFSVYTGNRTFVRSWVWWYLARAPIGLGLAVLVYFVVRGGLVNAAAPGSTQTPGQSNSAAINPYGLGALGALAGLCSEIATQKLREVFTVIFRPEESKKDPVTGSLRVISVTPGTAAAGSPDTDVTVAGNDFKSGDEILLDGAPLPTHFVGPRELRVTLPMGKLAQKAGLQLCARRGGLAGTYSDPVLFEVV